MNLSTRNLILPSDFPIDMQILIADMMPDFIPWSLASYEAGFRRFTFTSFPKNLILPGPPIVVNDVLIRNKLNRLSPGLIWSVVFEKNNGHKLLESIIKFDWESIVKNKSISITGVDDDTIEIPPEICQLRLLQRFGISDCNISPRLPTRIGMLTKLREFWYCDNDKPLVIPKQLLFLTNLRKLTVETEHIPEELSKLTLLKELRIYGNYKLSTLPELFFPGLRVLSISNTILRGCVPAWISRLSNLLELDLPLNHFDSFGRITQRLNYFNINGNCLKSLPVDCGTWLNVRYFDISYNMIEELPSSVQYLDSMRVCVLYGNPLRIIPDGIILLERSCDFYIDDNGYDSTYLSTYDKRLLNSCYNDTTR